VRYNIDVALQYMEGWLRGVGCVPIHNLMVGVLACLRSCTEAGSNGMPIHNLMVGVLVRLRSCAEAGSNGMDRREMTPCHAVQAGQGGMC